MKKKETQTFEEKLKRIEEIVSLMESGNLPLEDSMKLFEEGTGLISSCSAQLDAAEQKVMKLKMGEDGTPEEVPFE